ncbi:MAG: SUMF1/EgtB/PvdO family nonheme iron enzyme, partial [Verrucomicrobia bacterium]|nr:SUMF1/EgtB/PvdO family nonheme iron enzyme [Verrucomicrobiota bacterium]
MHSPSGSFSSRLIACIILVLGHAVLHAAPVVSNITASQRPGTKLVDITYDLAAPGFGAVAVTLEASSDGGATWTVPVTSVTGAVGAGVTPGTGKTIVWDAGADWPQSYSTQMGFRITADDGAPPGFSYIPGGSFTMGVTSGDTDSDAPSITVTVSSFYIQQTETTKAQWDEVRNWAVNNGYTDLFAGRWKAPNHPVQKVSWWEVVKWCNARSEKEGLTPVYTVFGAVMRTGTTEPVANWSANGYRLPTEAEWEKAARGGVSGKRFPWGADTISYAQANFSNGGSSEAYATGTTTWHPSYDDGVFPYTSPVGSFAPNGYGLYDMAGNVLEWCWDWYGSSYYTTSNGTTDPRGPVSGSGTVWTGSSWSYSGRVIRGGSWSAGPRACRAAARFNDVPGPVAPDTAGFRPVRSSVSEGGVVLPTVSNPTSSSINAIDATLGGNVTADGGAAITERGVVYSATATNADPLIDGAGVTKVTATGTTGVFTATVTGLTQGTDYSYKAYAINSQGTTYTSVGTFTSQSTNADLSSLTASSGVLSPTFSSVTTAYNASVSNSTSSITITPTRAQTDATMELRVNSGPYSAVSSGSASGALVLNVGSNTVEVLVTAQDGVTQKTYTVTVTRMAAPTVTSPTASSVTTTGATLGGNVTADGGATITERGVVYSVTSTNPNPSIGGVGVSKVAASGNMGVFTVEVTGLALCDGYSYKAYATNSQGTSYSSVGTFTNRMPYAFRPEAPPYTLPVTSEGGALLSYSIMSGSSIASVSGNVLTFTGQMGPVTLRATGAEIDDQFLTFRVESSPNWKKVFTGTGAPGNYTYGLKEDGSIWSWGSNVSQNLGVAGLGFRRRSLQMGTDSNWADLSAGEAGFCFAAIKTDGRLFTWGSNDAGQLGIGTTTNSFTPVLVDGSTDWKQAAVGSAHMIALKQDGSLWAWGSHANGRLGDGTTVNQSVPVRIGTDVDWKFVAAGHAASYAIKNDGTLWAWGFNGGGRLGDGTTIERGDPTRIGASADWAVVEGGNTHTMALKTDGSLWIWGANASGQIGNDTTANQLSPLNLMPGMTWLKIYAGRDNSMAIRTDGTLWAWGSNTLGQLGDGTFINQLSPVQVGYHHDWKEIACAGHSVGIREDGRMWSWGTDDDGELGNTSWWHNPIGGAATNVSSFSTGISMTAFVRKDGSLWTLGTNSNLCLGLGLASTSSQRWEPTRVGTANDWVSVTAGEYHVLALKRDGTIWAWGRNSEGQLGVANTVNQSTPVQVGSDSDWMFVEAGTNHSMAIKADGSLWSWGVNTNGQLGIGTLNSSSIPVRVGSLNDWKTVSAANHNLALKRDGSIWAWGMNNQSNGGGQIGNGTTTDVLSPVRVGTEMDWAKVEAGSAHSLALKTTGSLWGWGSNVWGEISQITRSTPGRIGTATDWKSITAGRQFTITIKGDGAVWTSGSNFGGRLGLGVGSQRNLYSVLTSTRLGMANAYSGTPDGGTANVSNVLLTKAGDLWAAGRASTANVGTHKRKLRPQIVFADLEQQTCSFGQNGNLQVGQSLSLDASSTSGLPIQYSIAGNGLISGNIVTATAPGKIEVVGWQAGDEVWDITPPMAITIDVSKADQEIHFAVISDKLTPDSVNLAAIGGGSNNPVTFVVTSGPAVISNNVLTFTNAGSVTITASQAGNDNYVAAPDVSRTFTVGSAQIATQPQHATAQQNGSATLSVVATGVGNLVYQWQKDGVDLPGATNATLTIPALKPWHLGTYRVRVSDSLDNAWSNTAQLSLNAIQPASLWQDLLLFLPFAGNTTDFSTSARTITQSNVGVGDSPAGTPSGSATFNGSSSRMDFSPDLPDLTEMTVSCWIKTTGASGSRFIFADWDDADGNDLSVSLDGLKLVVGTTKNGSTIGYWTSPDVFVADSWKHLIWVMGATQSKIFIDGVLYQTINGTASNSGYKLNSNIGYSAYGGGQQFLSGGLTAFRIYGRALTESEAVQLYQSDAPMPEIELEQPTGTALVDGSATSTWQALPTGGVASPVTYVIRNVGEANLLNLGLTKSGTHAADFSISSLASTTLSSGQSSSFTVTFAPGAGASGTRTATLQVASNDADENPFDIALSSTAYSTTLDADSDGMNDWGEDKLSALGFDWQTPNTALVSTYYENASAAGLYNQTLYNANRTAGQSDVINSPNAYSLYTLSQVQNLNVGVPLLQR